MAKIKLSLSQMGLAAKLNLLKKVKLNLTGNATFATPNPSLVTLAADVTAADAFENAINALNTQIATQVQSRHMFYDNTIDLHLAALAAYVESTALGDPAKIVSSGFELAGSGGAPVVLTAVTSLAATMGDDPGELDLSWDRVTGATLYEVWRNSDPNNAAGWVFVCTCTKSSTTVTGLTSGTKYWFRVHAKGGNETVGPWSDPATSIAP
jgi:hypothetical protein